jgi:hypothetical protein
LRWETRLHGNAGEFGKYAVLSVLPDMIVRFLYEYHDSEYTTSLDLPLSPLALDRSDQGVLEPSMVARAGETSPAVFANSTNYAYTRLTWTKFAKTVDI